MQVLILLLFVAAVSATKHRCKHKHEHYNHCGTGCPVTCANTNIQNPQEGCADVCHKGCECDNGYFRKFGRNKGRCVLAKDCPRQNSLLGNPGVGQSAGNPENGQLGNQKKKATLVNFVLSGLGEIVDGGPLGDLGGLGNLLQLGGPKEDQSGGNIVTNLLGGVGNLLGIPELGEIGQKVLESIVGAIGEISDETYPYGSEFASACLSPFEAKGCERTAGGIKTKAFLFTRKNPDNPEFLHLCNWTLPNNTNFNKEDRTEIFVHGWLDGVCRTEWMREMKYELLKRGSFNVILIDWTWGNGLEYRTGAENVYVVKEDLAALIRNIMKKTGVGPETFHLIGHSFGAQIVGLTGKLFGNPTANQPAKLRRITGLDPALAFFYYRPPTQRIFWTDGILVDIIHSNGGNASDVGNTIGDIEQSGQADFYPNGGRDQASCQTNILSSLLTGDALYAAISVLPNFCSHLQSIQFYKATINQCLDFVGVLCSDYESFQAKLCNSGECTPDNLKCAVMGMDYEEYPHPTPDNSEETPDNKYYLKTGLDYPYCNNN